MSDNLIVDTQFVHSAKLEDRKTNRYCTSVKEKIVTINKDTDEIVDVKNNVKVYEDIQRTIYITKPQYRTHKYKKFHEDRDKCDAYVMRESEMVPTLLRLLNDEELNRQFNTKKFISLKQIFNNPYVYNGDISTESLIRGKYIANKKSNKVVYTFGGLDIETSVLGDERVIANAVCVDSGNVYQTVLNDFMWHVNPVTGEKTRATAKDIEDLAYELLGEEILKPLGIKLHIKAFDSEVDVITKPILKINELSIDFMGIWNISYDIPYITKRLDYLKIDPTFIFNHKNIPKKYKHFDFKEDRSTKKSSIADKWHWCTNMGATQWYDQMLVYARKRSTDAKKDSYSLESISTDELGIGKLKTSSASHYEMQSKHFVEYAVYNILDAILLYMLEKKNKDILAWLKLTDTSALKDFAYQTYKLRDRYSKYCLDTGKVFATCGSNMAGPYDDTFTKSGGAVLNAKNVVDVGLSCIVEVPNLESMILALCGDIDFEAMYPNFITAFCLSKESKLFTITNIEGFDQYQVGNYCGMIGDVTENAVFIGSEFYNLPNYEEIETLFNEEFLNTVGF